MNSWSFTGNLGNAAEQRFTPAGDSVVSFSVATKSGFGDKATTTWARCSMFGKRGEAVIQYLQKGQMVGIVGELAAREWTNKEGAKQTSIEVRVNDLSLLGAKPAGQGNQNSENYAAGNEGYAPAPQRSAQGAPPSKKSFDDLDDSIPF